MLDTIATPRGTTVDNPFLGPPPERTAAVICSLGSGLKAVKCFAPATKSVQYAIYNEKDRPVAETAFSLAELNQRYPR